MFSPKTAVVADPTVAVPSKPVTKGELATATAHLSEMFERALADAAHPVVGGSNSHATGRTRKLSGNLCPVTGRPTARKSMFAGLGSDAKAKSAINRLLEGDTGVEADLAKMADPDRIRRVYEHLKAKGVDEIARPTQWFVEVA